MSPEPFGQELAVPGWHPPRWSPGLLPSFLRGPRSRSGPPLCATTATVLARWRLRYETR